MRTRSPTYDVMAAVLQERAVIKASEVTATAGVLWTGKRILADPSTATPGLPCCSLTVAEPGSWNRDWPEGPGARWQEPQARVSHLVRGKQVARRCRIREGEEVNPIGSVFVLSA